MKKTLSSPLVAAANNIVSLGSRSNSLPRFQRDFNTFSKFLEVEKRSLEKLKLPDKKKIKALASLNIASNFGRPGNLLGSLFSGALDLAGFVGNMFPGRGKFGKPQKPSNVRPPKPILKGPKLKLGGMRAVGVGNALFAGLDFATGLAEGESVGKAAAGAGGALAGGLLGGVIGQTLIPIPGLGFVIGNMAGSFLGGYAADRVYEGGSSLKQKLAERLKGQEAKQKALTGGSSSFSDSISKFEQSVGKFEEFINKSFASVVNAAAAAAGSDEMMLEYGEPEPDIKGGPGNGKDLPDVEAEGGRKPSSSIITSGYGWRWGRQHYGTDYGEPGGTPVSVIQPGRVAFAGYTDGGGNTVHLDHPDGSQTRYLHFRDSPNVKTGQMVEPGTVIGYVGTTGRSTGDHLHFEYAPPGQGSINSAPYADKYFRFGGNVKVKPKTGVSGAGSNPFVLELHADPNAKGQKTGLIPSNTSPDTAVSQALVSSFGTYGKNYRGGLGVTNRGGNILESDMALGAEANAKKIVEAMMKDPKRAYHIFAGHADVTKGETGAAGEKEYNLKTAELVEKLAKAQKLNVMYHKSIIANEASDPNSNLSRIKAIMDASKRPGIGGPEADPKMLEMYKQGLINQMSNYPSYNQPGGGASVIMPIMMGGGGGGQQRPVYIPVGGGGGGGTVIMPGPTEGQVVNSLMKTMLLTNLSAT
jgi:murein DD-endopeptidase MepM/ murein hydrolase activator NlpD